MLKERCGHGTVSIENKMFVIARFFNSCCEIFDSISNNFTILKINPHIENIDYYSRKVVVYTVGYKIHVFQAVKKDFSESMEKSRVFSICYDVKEKSWVSENNCNPECVDNFCFAKMFKY